VVTEADVKTKTNEELLDIWKNQHGYIPELVTWVKTEIDRRQLDITHIHVQTSDEFKQELQISNEVYFVRYLSIFQIVIGGAIVLFSIFAVYPLLFHLEDISLMIVPLVIFIIGSLILYFGISLIRIKKWACYTGGIFYCILAVLNLVRCMDVGRYFLKGVRVSVHFPFMNILALFVCGGIALALFRIQKGNVLDAISRKEQEK
jgi:hypothetical protein